MAVSIACGTVIGSANSGQCFQYTGAKQACSLSGVNYDFFRFDFGGTVSAVINRLSSLLCRVPVILRFANSLHTHTHTRARARTHALTHKMHCFYFSRVSFRRLIWMHGICTQHLIFHIFIKLIVELKDKYYINHNPVMHCYIDLIVE